MTSDSNITCFPPQPRPPLRRGAAVRRGLPRFSRRTTEQRAGGHFVPKLERATEDRKAAEKSRPHLDAGGRAGINGGGEAEVEVQLGEDGVRDNAPDWPAREPLECVLDENRPGTGSNVF